MHACCWIWWFEGPCCVSEVSLSSDFIAGFCGETEEDHLQTVSLLREVRYNVGFLFAYSMRKVSRQQSRGASHSFQDSERFCHCYFSDSWFHADGCPLLLVCIKALMTS